MNNLVQTAVSLGGRLAPIVIPNGLTSGTGLMNPSVFVTNDGKILVNLRHVNYTLYHSENTQKFPSRWGPLAYLHPEQDLTLRTINYLVELSPSFEVKNYSQIDTSKLDKPPIWEFAGEEDCRLIEWDNDLYIIGVRRDTTDNGQGRMELSKLNVTDDFVVTEVSRERIPAPGDDSSYCEKNWMPILDAPFRFVKWTSPTEVVEAKVISEGAVECHQVSLQHGVTTNVDQRGGSHVVPWGDYYIALTHEVNLFNNYLGQKDGVYRHRLAVWNREFVLVGLTPTPFSFLEAEIEFACGAAKFGEDLLVTFGFQDNAAYILQLPNELVETMIEEALSYGK